MTVKELISHLNLIAAKGMGNYKVGREEADPTDPLVYFEEIKHCQVAEEADGEIVLIW